MRSIPFLLALSLVALPLAAHDAMAGAKPCVPTASESTVTHEDTSVIVETDGALHIYEETNGIAGLQRADSGNRDETCGRPADQRLASTADVPRGGAVCVTNPVGGPVPRACVTF